MSVITGDLYIQKEDILIAGVEPISLGRSYVSQKGKGYWNFLSYHQVFMDWESKVVEVMEPSGAILLYTGVRSPETLKEEKEHEGTIYGDALLRSGGDLTFTVNRLGRIFQ